jgi:predicted metalloprotease
MKWQRLRRSSNVDDIRGRGPRFRRGALGRIPLRLGSPRNAVVVIAILIAVYFIGGPDMLYQLLGGDSIDTGSQTAEPGATANDEASQFVAAILASTEDEWHELFEQAGDRYEPPRLTLFAGSVQSACGYATAASGPFYCPADRRVYLDTTFFADLARMGGPGDFGQAYVIGHEIGHHVQTLLGTSSQVRNAQSGANQAVANRLQVAMELQADCYAGVWANRANRTGTLLEPGDVDEGIAAAAAIGDDRLAQNAGRRVTPDSFTHGTSAQRQQWLRTGLASGEPLDCDTFANR